MWLVIGVRVRDQFLLRLSHRIWFSLRMNNHLSNSGVQDFSSGYTTWISPEGKDINILPAGSEERAQQITTFCSPAWQHKHSPTGLAFTKLFSLCWSSRAVRKTQQPYLTHPLPNRKSNKIPFLPTLTLSHFAPLFRANRRTCGVAEDWLGGKVSFGSLASTGQSPAQQLHPVLNPCVKTNTAENLENPHSDTHDEIKSAWIS